MPSTNEGMYRVAGMYGVAIRNGRIISEAVEVQSPVEIGRIDVPLAGTATVGHKPGPITREGSMTIQHIDTSWEMEIWEAYLSKTEEQRRALRGTGRGTLKPFQLQLEYNDPDALGYEVWQLEGCMIWRLPLGFSRSDEIVNRELPLTWESERPLAHYERTGNTSQVTGLPEVVQTDTRTAV